MRNLVTRLHDNHCHLCHEAADEIERLQKREKDLMDVIDSRDRALGFVPLGDEPSPQAPIAKLTIPEGHDVGIALRVELYAPGLPPGEHDLYCEPMSVAPAPPHPGPSVEKAFSRSPRRIEPQSYCPNCDCDYCGAVKGRLEREAQRTKP